MFDNCKGLTLQRFDNEIGSKIYFPNFIYMHFIYQLFEGLEMREMLAHVFNFSNGYANPKIIC